MFGDFTTANDPYALFDAWLADATASEPNDPNAMTLATVDGDGLPDARIVLLKGHDRDGFVFYTNTESAKGVELAASPRAALVFHWKSLLRQVRVRGSVHPVTAAEADAYYQSRPLNSRIGAWASQQSRPLQNRQVLEEMVKSVEARFSGGEVPRPPHWSGYRIAPSSIEFWHDRPFRLHDRIRFSVDGKSGNWLKQRLFP
jgi:pyridoxamine 5'-phosphate oxidase